MLFGTTFMDVGVFSEYKTMTMSYAGTGGQLRAPKAEGMGSNLGVTWRRLIDSNIGGG